LPHDRPDIRPLCNSIQPLQQILRILIPALGTIFPEKAEPGWMKYYQLVGVNVSRGAVGAAVHTLNGCNMYDILRILNKLASDKPGPAAFNRLLDEYAGISGVGHLRLGLAFAAVLARSAGKSAWSAFRERFPSVSTLADFEQKDIEQFIQG
jgi:hypothetical protein